jgi:hypothetical protein
MTETAKGAAFRQSPSKPSYPCWMSTTVDFLIFQIGQSLISGKA